MAVVGRDEEVADLIGKDVVIYLVDGHENKMCA